MSRAKRRLRHRIPIRLRQHWKLVAVAAAFPAVLVGALGAATVHPYVTSTYSAESKTVTQDIKGRTNLFDTTVAHELKITFTDADYQEMLTGYFTSGEKKYLEADLVIDGTTIPSVGIRLKGNSTLAGLTWKGRSRQRGAGGAPAGNAPRGRPGGGPGGPAAALRAEEPEDLPWLISFDEFVEGRRYQGRTQIAVRPATQFATLLNEALAISVVGASGEPSQRYSYGSFSVNGRSSGPRLLVEYLDEGYAQDLGNGVLYKALATGRFAYRGEDQTRYTGSFKQISRKGSHDLQPVIDLIRWVEKSSEEEFTAGLADRVDVPSLARYLALQNLLLNFDDMAGPGQNYYLWHDLGTGRFTVVTWDLNVAFSGDPETGPHDTLGMGGPGGMRPPGRAGGRAPSPPRTQGGAPFPGGAPPGAPGGRGEGPAAGRGGDGGPMGRMGHPLKTRFLADETFRKVYQEQYRALYQRLLANGTASALLEEVVRAYTVNEGADAARAGREAATLRQTLAARTKALAGDETITG